MVEMEQAQERRRIRALLWEWGRALERCKRLEDDLRDVALLREGLDDPLQAQRITGMPGTGQISDSTARTAEMAEDRRVIYDALADQIQDEIHEVVAMKRAIDRYVADLVAVDRRIIELRYVRECSWVYIGIKTGYDEDHVKRRERKIVDDLCKDAAFYRFF